MPFFMCKLCPGLLWATGKHTDKSIIRIRFGEVKNSWFGNNSDIIWKLFGIIWIRDLSSVREQKQKNNQKINYGKNSGIIHKFGQPNNLWILSLCWKVHLWWRYTPVTQFVILKCSNLNRKFIRDYTIQNLFSTFRIQWKFILN
jgi:hypothetical protein